jgi:FixJ family two-component response regulator
MTTQPIIHVVDDEEDVRNGVRLLLRSNGHTVRAYASPVSFLEQYRHTEPGCLLLDVRMPEMTGMELQQQLIRRGIATPIVFISGHGDIPMAVRAVQAGALDFLEKPFSEEALLACITRALEVDKALRTRTATEHEMAARLAQLTPREREVLDLLVEGAVNKIIARKLDLSTRTVEIHRARVLSKMGVQNVAQLARIMTAFESTPIRDIAGGTPHVPA